MDSQHGFLVLHEDAATIIVSKPSGVLTQAPPGIDCLEWRIKRYLQLSRQSVKEPYLGVPHRLDRLVSGAIVFAKTKNAARWYAEQFQKHRVEKKYWALVEGVIHEPTGVWLDWMHKIDDESRSEIVAESHPQAKHAELHYTLLQQLKDIAWIEITLKTGRSHQIRLQAGSRGHAVLGDEQYGSKRLFGEQFEDARLRSIALHARSLEITLADTRQLHYQEAPIPEAWKAYLPDLAQ